jgi:dTDP-4-dehydrorhamnose 3,5-epimerase-like enzyme
MDSSSLISTTFKTNAAFFTESWHKRDFAEANDPELAIDWPIKDPILSKRDQNQMSLQQYRENPAVR